MEVFVSPEQVRINANHLKRVSDDTLKAIIEDVHVVYILDYATEWSNKLNVIAKLKVIEKLLAQHMATINVRRADSESVTGLSKSISVPKGEDLSQTEYGQMAKKIAKDLGLSWASDNELASVVIY